MILEILMFKKLTLLALALFALSACGPIYNTEHKYHPPQNMEGRYCVNSCDMMRQSCINGCKDRQNNCEILANTMDSMMCMQHGKCPKKKKWYESDEHRKCSSSNCKSNCSGQYRRCFENCGGVIEPITTCIAFCDKA